MERRERAHVCVETRQLTRLRPPFAPIANRTLYWETAAVHTIQQVDRTCLTALANYGLSYALLSLLFTYPLVTRLNTHVPGRLEGDVLLYIWKMCSRTDLCLVRYVLTY